MDNNSNDCFSDIWKYNICKNDEPKYNAKSIALGHYFLPFIFLLMGFDDHDEEKEIGRYQTVQLKKEVLGVMDTTNGQLVKYMNLDNVFQEAEDNYGQIKGGVKF